QVVHLYRIGRWVGGCVRERATGESVRRRGNAGRHDKRLNAETTDEVPHARPGAVGLDVALIPGHAKRWIRNLDYKKIKPGVGWEAGYLNVHVFHRSERVNCNPPLCIGNTSSSYGSA